MTNNEFDVWQHSKSLEGAAYKAAVWLPKVKLIERSNSFLEDLLRNKIILGKNKYGQWNVNWESKWKA